MARENMGYAVPSATVQRVVYGGASFVLQNPSGWFGPGQPIAPAAQEQAKGRTWDYPTAINVRLTPRQDAGTSFADLRGLADAYDLLRLVIETRKDQLQAYEWEIVAADDKQQDRLQKDCDAMRTFLEKPSLEHEWDNWLRALAEDMLVIDAVAIYPRRNKGGKVMSLDVVDAATVKRVIDDSGRTPLPPEPAYQQVIKGLAAVNYHADELAYWMRNPRSNRLYGFGPVEQIIMTVNIALRRQISTLQYYTEGNVPEAIIGVPKEWSVEQVKQFQAYWDSILEGNTAQRRHAKFVPDGVQFHPTKDVMLKDMFDEWLARIVCYAFSVAPTPFVKETNRSVAEQVAQAAKEEGIMPLLTWLARRITGLLHRVLERPDLKFQWKLDATMSPEQQSVVHDRYLRNGVLSLNDVLADLGRKPVPGGDTHLIFTGGGAVPLEQVLNPPEPPAVAAPGTPGASGEEPAGKPKGTQEAKQPGAAAQAEESKTEKMVAALLAKVAEPREQPDVYVSVAPPAVNVTVEAPHQEQPVAEVVGKSVRAVRGEDGVLRAEVTEVLSVPTLAKRSETRVRTIEAQRMPDGSLKGTVTDHE